MKKKRVIEGCNSNKILAVAQPNYGQFLQAYPKNRR
jgi:hypothetical protein